jgi:hypothetical protein
MHFCTDFKAVAETNLGTVLSETKDVEKLRSGAPLRMPTDRAEVVGTDRRNSMLNLKLETDFWSQLWKTITSPILLRF